MKATAVVIAAIATLAVTLSACGTSTTESTPPPATVVTAPATGTLPASSAVELVPHPEYGTAAYHCKADYVPVQVPVGHSMQANGVYFSLGEERDSFNQKHVDFRVQLPAKVSAPTLIINTAAHIQAPDVYPQHQLQVALEPGAVGSYRFITSAYAENFLSGGITDITVCTKSNV